MDYHIPMLRWIVIGIGDITSKRVLPAILVEPRSVLAGIVTRDPAKAAAYSVPAFRDLAAAFAECPADAVYVASPVFLHAPQTIAALEAGKHVLCEKPMALNYTEAQSMQQAAERTGRTLGVAYYRRLYPKVARALQLIESGAIGRPVFVEATSHGWTDFADGFRGWIADPKQSGGGPLRDVASHRIDLMNYMFGEPARVSGQISKLVQPIEVEDNATVLIEYERGVRGMVDVRWHSRVARDEFRIRGTEGEIELSPLNGPTLTYPGGVEEIPAHANLHYPCVADFVSAVLDGRTPASSGASALDAEWVMERSSERSADDVLEELIRREPIFHREEFGRTRRDFENMTVADFRETGASGRQYGRELVLDTLEKRYAGPYDDVWEASEFRCRKLSDDVYLLTYTLLQDNRRKTRRATIWQRTPAGWKIVYHQGTAVES